jgi:hypothetical protein
VRGSLEMEFKEEDEEEGERDEEEDEINSNFQENSKFELLGDAPHTDVEAWPDTTNTDFLFTERDFAELIVTRGTLIDSDTSK